jgi:hypothetical protein
MALRWIVLALLLSGCHFKRSSLTVEVDKLSFELAGGTLFSEPSQVTTKEIHFDTGSLAGQDVIVEGEVQTTGKYFTHLVVNDEFGRMLVVLTQVEGAESFLLNHKPKHLKVWGTVERGKKGLPYVLAKALTPAQS